MNLVDKIKFILSSRQLTPSHFADEIGVQRSSISHILSGRNRPSLEIVQKIVNRFPDITYDWLLESNDSHPTNQIEPHLSGNHSQSNKSVGKRNTSTNASSIVESVQPVKVNASNADKRTIRKIMIFYNDDTFEEFIPS